MIGDLAFWTTVSVAFAFFALEFHELHDRTGLRVFHVLDWMYWCTLFWSLGIVVRLLWWFVADAGGAA